MCLPCGVRPSLGGGDMTAWRAAVDSGPPTEPADTVDTTHWPRVAWSLAMASNA
jgi:hypothetical protein